MYQISIGNDNHATQIITTDMKGVLQVQKNFIRHYGNPKVINVVEISSLINQENVEE